jgi:hypothetical protein
LLLMLEILSGVKMLTSNSTPSPILTLFSTGSSSFMLSRHLLHTNVFVFSRSPFTLLHFLYTRFVQRVGLHSTELDPAPVLQTPQGHLPNSDTSALRPFFSLVAFHLSILIFSSSMLITVSTRSSAYRISHGNPSRISLTDHVHHYYE